MHHVKRAMRKLFEIILFSIPDSFEVLIKIFVNQVSHHLMFHYNFADKPDQGAWVNIYVTNTYWRLVHLFSVLHYSMLMHYFGDKWLSEAGML